MHFFHRVIHVVPHSARQLLTSHCSWGCFCIYSMAEKLTPRQLWQSLRSRNNRDATMYRALWTGCPARIWTYLLSTMFWLTVQVWDMLFSYSHSLFHLSSKTQKVNRDIKAVKETLRGWSLFCMQLMKASVSVVITFFFWSGIDTCIPWLHLSKFIFNRPSKDHVPVFWEWLPLVTPH